MVGFTGLSDHYLQCLPVKTCRIIIVFREQGVLLLSSHVSIFFYLILSDFIYLNCSLSADSILIFVK